MLLHCDASREPDPKTMRSTRNRLFMDSTRCSDGSTNQASRRDRIWIHFFLPTASAHLSESDHPSAQAQPQRSVTFATSIARSQSTTSPTACLCSPLPPNRAPTLDSDSSQDSRKPGPSPVCLRRCHSLQGLRYGYMLGFVKS